MNSLPLRVLELYSGIGGMHCALGESEIPYEIVAAIDINTTANKIYRHNFPKSNLLESGIETLTVKQLDKWKIDMILMSPPCQPFTRVGKKRDAEDVRTNSFLHLLDLLPRLHHCPSYILVENVKGFEVSQTRDTLINTLKKCDFEIQECLLTPLQFGVPNARLRYYLIAKRKPLMFHFPTTPDEVMENVPEIANHWLKYKQKIQDDQPKISKHAMESDFETATKSSHDKDRVNHKSEENCSDGKNIDSSANKDTKDEFESNANDMTSYVGNIQENKKLIHCDFCKDGVCLENYGHIMRQEDEQDIYPGCQRLNSFLENKSSELLVDYILPDKDLKRFVVMDIVHPCLKKSSCFTKRYGHFMEGACSLVQMSTNIQDVQNASEFKMQVVEMKNRDEWGEAELSIIRSLQLRYFTPREIANLLCFPSTYDFPTEMSRIQLYRVLGNSLNVHVVSVLIRLLVLNDSITSLSGN